LHFYFKYPFVEYNPAETEARWQQYWSENKTFRSLDAGCGKPPFYVLDMFPYPSGAGLHVGHPLGYIASDIVARYRRARGFNVLHPMGYDSFGLPAEQYAIQTGQHPALTTEQNIRRYREQMDKLGFSFDWSREVRTSDPAYYQWTQWIFTRLFHSWYNFQEGSAAPISTLIQRFEESGFHVESDEILTGSIEKKLESFSAEEWKSFSEKRKEDILMHFRLAFLDDSWVNWCPALGTVLANDEVKDGVSERGGHPVERKLMKQWSMRITSYAERLLSGLEKIDWPESTKEAQRNWIGKSSGASVRFRLQASDIEIEVFTTRPDTIFGVSFLVLAPEHELVSLLIATEQESEALKYITYAKNRSERERQAEVKNISGCFTGSYAVHPFEARLIPIWIADYVLAGYGTGAVMGVPAGDQRDFDFARHFALPIPEIMEGANLSQKADPAKDKPLCRSGFLNGLCGKEAIRLAIKKIEEAGIGSGKINYRLRDAVFGRQRYWGEPIPVYYENDIARTLLPEELPLILPEIDRYLPTETGEPPLGRARNWNYKGGYNYELSTMPGWAGSSWYYLRYMDPSNSEKLFSAEAEQYWQQVDLYIGGSEHATGHLLYSRFWHKFLKDIGLVSTEEPFKKLVNQGMIQGTSEKLHKIEPSRSRLYNVVGNYNESGELVDSFYELLIEGKQYKFGSRPSDLFISENALHYFDSEKPDFTSSNVDVKFVHKGILDVPGFSKAQHYSNAIFLADGGFWHQGEFTSFGNGKSSEMVCFQEVEKMSKSKYNVVNPDDICAEYGADTLRLYEMFLGPLEQSKPWNTNGIEGVFRFLKKLWNLFPMEKGMAVLDENTPSAAELKILHKTIRKASDDIESLSLNTTVSAFMVCVNELSQLKCRNREILGTLIRLIAPFAPHIAEELWMRSGNSGSVCLAPWPEFNEVFLREDEVNYPVSVNGKVRTQVKFPADMPASDIEKQILAMESVQKWLEGKAPKKIIVVPKKIVNVVI
jgi:leucyl-tRNA synthetase